MGVLGAVESLYEYMSMLDMEQREVHRVKFSISKHKNTEKEVGYLRLGDLAECQPHTSFTAVRINRNNNKAVI